LKNIFHLASLFIYFILFFAVLDVGAASLAPEVPIVYVKEERDEAMDIIFVKEEPFNYDQQVPVLAGI
jgi:hypothetical protein